jgi:deoxyuridine 5'-triphosphate nucleotidohydrolase
MSDIPVFRFVLDEGLPDKFLPTKGSEKATGWDVRSSKVDVLIKPGEYAKISLGFRAFAPDGWWLELHPRSSTFVKKHLHALYGVIDEDYEGECIFACHLPKSESSLLITFGEALGQLIPVRRQEMVVEKVSNEEYLALTKQRNFARGAGGFGSTGK